MTGTYAVNGTEFTLQPTYGAWQSRETLGVDGNGHNVYESTYAFEIGWQLASQGEFYQLLSFFDNLNVSGSAVVSLPKLRSSSYQFFDYTGCVVQEPTLGKYFVEYPESVTLLITNIRA
jgi:hypothetical protein